MKIYNMIPVIGILLLFYGCSSSPHVQVEAPTMKIVEPKEAQNKESFSLYNANKKGSLFAEKTTFGVGDIVEIYLSEKTSAQKSATTATNKASSGAFGAPVLFGKALTLGQKTLLGKLFGLDEDSPISANYNSSNSFAGNGSATQSNKLQGTVVAYITKVLPNGNLVIKGSKKIVINKGLEYITITGVIRSEDIDVNNRIPSFKIAGADIVYSGDGFINDANDMPAIERFLNKYWPF